ncbi:D-alanyl-D-alanine carboxypeptidase/D-alanyl-D-alanine-endopeptidase [Nocardioides iriomotensis]|uniref:D-alanyl-D-alanine carboxypeptidase/D-alanyl-D-alanine-endopeptidase n=1 Tax=Nocardioides iriomotensis TaxID=715784 RepID=A0A4V1Z151_9ACTN|nr:D-alanyl-D-alanine carboxypeptidase/D-alanyl-D-alanine-endopeptidase [Nocardioides iriomotensis]
MEPPRALGPGLTFSGDALSRISGLVLAVTTAVTATSGLVATNLTTAPAAQVAQTQAADPALTLAIDTILADPRFTGSMVSVAVRDANTGEALYERNTGQRLNPASNMKLFTSAAAMDALGPDHRFTTDVLATAPVVGGKVRSDLFLRGGGDPTMLAEDYRDLAAQLKAAGVQRVDGNLVADDSYFDDVPLATAWSWDDEPYYYSAVTSALTVAPDTDYDSGTAIVETSPGSPGAKPTVALQPATDAVTIVNNATTGAAGSANTLSVEREHASDKVFVTGSIPAGASINQEWVTVPDPTTYAADVFARALRAQGITVSGAVREGATPGAAKVLASHDSMALSGLLVPFMKLSNNMHAEALVKTLGAEATGTGSWQAGLAQVRAYAQEKGVDTNVIRISDGSGLSRFDLLTTDAVADLLVAAKQEPWFQAWYDALPIAGNADRFTGGTLRSRMRNTAATDNLHGKTGSMTSVTALSGYVSNADGRELVFSMISNNYLASPRSQEDALGVTLAQWSEADGAAPPTADSRSLRRSTDYGPADIECSWAKAC